MGVDPRLQPGAAGDIELEVDQAIAPRTSSIDSYGTNLLQGLDIDESLGLEQVDEQIRGYLSKKAVRVIELFRQWDDDQTGKIEKAEFRRGMRELGMNVSKAKLDELFDMWDPDKSGVLTIEELQKLLRRGTEISYGDTPDKKGGSKKQFCKQRIRFWSTSGSRDFRSRFYC